MILALAEAERNTNNVTENNANGGSIEPPFSFIKNQKWYGRDASRPYNNYNFEAWAKN